jgi:cobalamin biosynthesis Mg chelatase CobN
MKLAPPQNTLQPLPPDVQPAVSESVQRTASPTDIQNAQLSQQNQNLAPGQITQQSGSVSPIAFSSSSVAAFPWIIVVILIVIVAAAIWFWRSF